MPLDDSLEGIPFKIETSLLPGSPVTDWMLWLEDEINKPNSTVQFALNWQKLNYFQRRDLVMQCQQGSASELCLVMRWILHCEPEAIWSDRNWVWGLDSLEELWGRGNFLCEHVESEHNIVPLPHFASCWRYAVLRWFGLRTQALKKRHYCVFDEYDWLVSITVSPPTQHERIEAMHNLREWAYGKVPDELLATLQ